jgi:hypothetical protein
MELNCQLNAPAALTPRKGPSVRIDRRLIGPHMWSGSFGEEKYPVLPGIKPGSFILGSIAICTQLPRLLSKLEDTK